jgi:hypothetical protein
MQEVEDFLYCHNKGLRYPLNFPANTIESGELHVRDVRVRAAGALRIPYPGILRLYFEGKLLENDFAPCRDYGLKCKSMIQCFVEGRVWGDERGDFDQFYTPPAAFKYTEGSFGEAIEVMTDLVGGFTRSLPNWIAS